MVEGARPGAELELAPAPASQVRQIFRTLAMAGPTSETVFDCRPGGEPASQ